VTPKDPETFLVVVEGIARNEAKAAVEQPVMTTGLERIAAKAREDRKLKITSLAHHVTEELLWDSVCHIPNGSARGSDGQTVEEAKKNFKQWAPGILRAIHNRGYQPPPILRVFSEFCLWAWSSCPRSPARSGRRKVEVGDVIEAAEAIEMDPTLSKRILAW
jgi:hypothetical protein